MRLFKPCWLVPVLMHPLASGATGQPHFPARQPAASTAPSAPKAALPSATGEAVAPGADFAARPRDAEPVETDRSSTAHAMTGVSVEPRRATKVRPTGQGKTGEAGSDQEPTEFATDPLPLARPTRQRDEAGTPPPHSAGRAITTVLGSLSIVLGLFLLVAWFARRALPRASASLPHDVVELLGRAPLGHRQQMQLVRLGNKLLLLSVAPNGAETLAEITDPVEVDRIAGRCRQNQSGSITDSFRQILLGAGDEHGESRPRRGAGTDVLADQLSNAAKADSRLQRKT